MGGGPSPFGPTPLISPYVSVVVWPPTDGTAPTIWYNDCTVVAATWRRLRWPSSFFHQADDLVTRHPSVDPSPAAGRATFSRGNDAPSWIAKADCEIPSGLRNSSRRVV